MAADPSTDDPAEILRRLKICLCDLDRIGAGLPAIHLATAIETLREMFIIPDDLSELD